MTKKLLGVVLTSAFFAGKSLAATISVSLQADLLQDQNGAAASKTGTYYLIASTTDASFSALNGVGGTLAAGKSTAVGTLLTSDDYIVARGTIDSGYTSPNSGNGILDKTLDGSGGNPPALDLSTIPGWNQNDPLALMWFPSISIGTNSFGIGVFYGIFTKSTATVGFSDAWITPADGTSNYSLGYFNASGGGLSAGPETATSGRASLQVATTPEPTSATLLMVGLVSLASRRRRQAK